MGAYDIEITDTYVHSHARCSCGCGNWYKHYKATFENYCPRCGHHGCLDYESGSVSYTCPEWMWYCTRCDADRLFKVGYTKN